MNDFNAQAQIATGSIMVAAPWWVDFLQNVNLVASSIVSVGGAFLVLRGVYRWWKKRRSTAAQPK